MNNNLFIRSEMSGQTVTIINAERQYRAHPMAEAMGCINFAHGKTLKNGDIAKVVHVHYLDQRIYVLIKNEQHYLIGNGGIKKHCEECQGRGYMIEPHNGGLSYPSCKKCRK